MPQDRYLTKESLCNFAKENCQTKIGKKQLRALVTSYCILNNIQVNSFAWDTLIIMLHNVTREEYPSWNRINMDNFLSKDLV
jgi:hypothetical protein